MLKQQCCGSQRQLVATSVMLIDVCTGAFRLWFGGFTLSQLVELEHHWLAGESTVALLLNGASHDTNCAGMKI